MKPSPRLRRILAIAHRSALWVRSTREYMTEINAYYSAAESYDGSSDDDCPF